MKRKASFVPLILSSGRHEVRRREEVWELPPLRGSTRAAHAPFCPSHSRASASDYSLAVSFYAALPTSVAVRMSSNAQLHLPSARRCQVFHMSLHLPVSSFTSARMIFFWPFQSGHSLKGRSRVWFCYQHPALRGGPVLWPVGVLPTPAVVCVYMAEARRKPMVLAATVASRFR